MQHFLVATRNSLDRLLHLSNKNQLTTFQHTTILTPILVPLTNLRQKAMETCLETQINKVKHTCAVDMPTSQIAKHFPHDTNHPSNKSCTASLDEHMGMLNNHDIWGLVGADNQSTLSIFHVPTVVSNSKADIFIRGFSGASLGTKLEAEMSQNSLLDGTCYYCS